MGALILVVASTALFVYKYFEDKEHAEKWKDYEECGIQSITDSLTPAASAAISLCSAEIQS